MDGNNLQPGDVLLLKSGVRGGWTAARQLRVGDALRSHDGQWLAVESVRDTGRAEVVVNARVAEYHTYFVGDQQWGFSLWAHNSCGPGGGEANGLQRLTSQDYIQGLRSRLPTRTGSNAPTHGIFAYVDDAGNIVEVPLQSGIQGPAQQLPRGLPGLSIVTRTHVEAHVAALMEQRGIRQGVLVINNPTCSYIHYGRTRGCSVHFEDWLPRESQVTVYGPECYQQAFTGRR